MINGQEKLIQELHKFNIDSFPRTLMLIGEKGSGKHLISQDISENILQLPMLDITDVISYEYITNIYCNSLPCIYIINLSTITEKNQNVMLKFIEEPLKNSYIILLAESEANILHTILNRCNKFYLAPYKKEFLSQFLTCNEDVDLILSVLKTPGQIINSRISSIRETYDLCYKICDKLNVATYSNTLTISNKLNYKDEFDKLDVDIFMKCLLNCFSSRYKETKSSIYYQSYIIASDVYKKFFDTRLNKKYLIESMLTQLWKFSRTA